MTTNCFQQISIIHLIHMLQTENSKQLIKLDKGYDLSDLQTQEVG